jgi:signal peptidase II
MMMRVVKKKGDDPALMAACSFIAGGGLGNLIDRLAFDGRVRDFLNLGIGGLRTGVFNAADLSIVIGCLILAARAFLPPAARPHPPETTVK